MEILEILFGKGSFITSAMVTALTAIVASVGAATIEGRGRELLPRILEILEVALGRAVPFGAASRRRKAVEAYDGGLRRESEETRDSPIVFPNRDAISDWTLLPRPAPRNLVVDARIDEIRKKLKRASFSASWAGRSNALLVTGQYITGGVLATSFVQAHLTQNLVGGLGLLVVLSSLVHQRFRPDLKQEAAKQQVVKFAKLLRTAEDEIFDIEEGVVGAKTVSELRRYVSQTLTQIEQDGVVRPLRSTRLKGAKGAKAGTAADAAGADVPDSQLDP